MTFTRDDRFVAPVKQMMLASREGGRRLHDAAGALHHIMAEGHHHGPGPWVDGADAGPRDWTSVYYHRADADGIGFDRTATGSDALALYRSPLREQLSDVASCPENLLLWFHHLPWDHRIRSSGRTLWDELCHRYSAGVDAVPRMQATWDGVAPFVDAARHAHVRGCSRSRNRRRAGGATPACSTSRRSRAARCPPASSRSRARSTTTANCPRRDVADERRHRPRGQRVRERAVGTTHGRCASRFYSVAVIQGVTSATVPPAIVKSCVARSTAG
jgi:hypothetical protein